MTDWEKKRLAAPGTGIHRCFPHMTCKVSSRQSDKSATLWRLSCLSAWILLKMERIISREMLTTQASEEKTPGGVVGAWSPSRSCNTAGCAPSLSPQSVWVTSHLWSSQNTQLLIVRFHFLDLSPLWERKKELMNFDFEVWFIAIFDSVPCASINHHPWTIIALHLN